MTENRKLIADNPLIWEIETSSACNLRCVMCPQSIDAVNRPRHMPESLVAKIQGQFSADTHCVSLHGIGEPFLSPSFWRILPQLVAGPVNKVNTNLTMLSDGMVIQILDSNLTLINVSMDTHDPGRYLRIRGIDIAKPLNNIRKLVAARDAAGSDLKIYTNMTLMLENICDLLPFTKLMLTDIGCDGVECWPMNNINKAHHAEYNQVSHGWQFNYEEQGLWHNKELYLAETRAAKDYATSVGGHFELFDTLGE